METYDVIVIGGGIIGLSAAIALSQRDFHVAVVDAGNFHVHIKKELDARVYAINQASEDLLKQLGVWSLLEPGRFSPYSHMHIWDGDSKAAIDFDARMIAKPHLGTIIEESVLKNVLLQKIKSLNIHLYPENTVTHVFFKDKHMGVQANEKDWQAKLVIVADGANSITRKLLGVNLTTWSYHQDALVANVETEIAHQNTAYQVFNPSGPLAFLPLANQNQCSIVWSLPPARAENLISLEEEEFNRQLRTAFAEKLGKVKLISKRYSFPLRMRHAKNYCGDYWVLMGDAAHTIHPLAGLGLNVGLEDLSVFLNLLKQYKNNLHSHKLLASYQRQRKAEVWQVITLMQALKGVFANPWLSGVRSVGLNCFNHLDFLKRFFIKVAG